MYDAHTLVRRFAIASLLWVSCDSTGSDLFVDLRTDYEPAVEFTHVVVTLDGAAGPQRVEADASNDYSTGVRVATFRDVDPGSYTASVELLQGAAPVAARRVSVTLEGLPVGVTAILQRRCRDVECPMTDEAPERSECFAQTCVEPECTPETPETCRVECVQDSDCAIEEACVVARCRAGACFETIDAECRAARPTAFLIAEPAVLPCGVTEVRLDASGSSPGADGAQLATFSWTISGPDDAPITTFAGAADEPADDERVLAGTFVAPTLNLTHYRSSSALRYRVDDLGEPEGINQVFQPDVTVVEDRRYVVRFAARAEPARPIQVALIQHTAPFSVWGLAETVGLTPTWATYSMEFLARGTGLRGTSTDGRLRIFGGGVATYSIDDVRLVRIDDARDAVSNGSFDDRLAPWIVDIRDGAVGDAEVVPIDVGDAGRYTVRLVVIDAMGRISAPVSMALDHTLCGG